MARSSVKQKFLLRAKLLLVFALILISLLFYRLYELQVVRHEYYLAKADRQHSVVSEYYDRGSIYFTKKDGGYFAAANIKTAYIIAINPRELEDPQKLFQTLKENGLDIDKERFFAKVRKKNDPYEELAKKVPQDIAEKLKEYKGKGLIIMKHRFRFYPAGSMASHALGFVARQNSDPELHGRYGLEAYYDDELYKNPRQLGVNFFAELFSGVKEAIKGDYAKKGSIITSLDPMVQAELERVVDKTRARWHSRRVSAIVYNPNNGEVVAMASSPRFDLNNFAKVKSVEIYENPLVENVYEMGSIVKAITVASGLDSGAIKETSKYYDSGCKVYNRSRICNYDKRARETVPVQEILSQSLNVGAAWVYEKMGKRKFKEYFEKLGLVELSGIDLPNEAAPLVGNLNSPRDIEFATASFGQGVAFSPVAMVRALGALGTGYIHTPHLAKYVQSDAGILIDISPKDEKRKVFSKETVESISRMLTEVVDSKLDNGKRKKEHYTVAAKTGTAELSSGKTYAKGIYNHTFFGYFPAFEPRFVVLFVNERPHGAKYASQTLTDPFYEMLDFLINYYNIEPDR